MLTENEQKIIIILLSKPHISLRGMIEELNLVGLKLSTKSVASIVYLIDSLEEKGFINKIGTKTNKYYQLTEKAIHLRLSELTKVSKYIPQTQKTSVYVSENTPLVVGSTGPTQNSAYPEYLLANFENGSHHSDTSPNAGTFLSASLTKIMDDPVSWGKYGNLIVWAIILSVIVLPLSYKVLENQWFVGFVLVALLLIIINKK